MENKQRQKRARKKTEPDKNHEAELNKQTDKSQQSIGMFGTSTYDSELLPKPKAFSGHLHSQKSRGKLCHTSVA